MANTDDRSRGAADISNVNGRVSPIDNRGVLKGLCRAPAQGAFVTIYCEDSRPLRVYPTVQEMDATATDSIVGRRFAISLAGLANPGDRIYVYDRDTDFVLPGSGVQRFPQTAARQSPIPPAEEADLDREQTQDLIAASEARTDTKFARLDGKLDLVLAQTSGLRSTVVVTGLSIFFGLAALLLAVMTYGDAIFSRGMSVRDTVKAVVEEQRVPTQPQK